MYYCPDFHDSRFCAYHIHMRNVVLGLFDIENSKFNFVILNAKYYIYKCKWDESKPNYNVFIKILKTCKDTEKMIALKNNRVDKWNSKWNKIYLWLVFRRIQIWSLWWFSFYVIWHYTNDGLLHCFHYNVHVLYHYFLCICERHDLNDRACVWFQALWKGKKNHIHIKEFNRYFFLFFE